MVVLRELESWVLSLTKYILNIFFAAFRGSSHHMDIQTVRAYISQRVPIIEFVNDIELTPEQQTSLIPHLKSVVNKSYIQSLLKSLISKYELAGLEILEELYEFYCSPDILNAKILKPTDLDIIGYNVNGATININETPGIISGQGTTGLRTWEAAMFLANYIPNLPLSGTVLELGTGTGLVGICLVNYNSIDQVIFTDGDSFLLENVLKNLQLNDRETHKYRINQLIWGDESYVPSCNYLIAADVTYDVSILDDLVSTLRKALKSGCKACYIAATVRNDHTLKKFEETLEFQGLSWNNTLEFDPLKFKGKMWFRPTTPIIYLYTITI